MNKIVTTGLILSLVIAARTCKQIGEDAGSKSERQAFAPMIEITPLEEGRGQWKIAAAYEVAVVVTAPGAERVQIQCRPEGVEEDYLEFQTLAEPVDSARRRFLTRLNLTPDFAGQMWAEASYPGGAKKRSGTIALTTDQESVGNIARLDAVGGSVGT